MIQHDIHEGVKAGYGDVASQAGDPAAAALHAQTGARLGYAPDALTGPAAAGNLGLGCGNPAALADLQPGQTVVDLGSGAGFDALLCAERLGPQGRFIGVDMTPKMLERARINAVNAGYAGTVEFREGLIEQLPITSDTADVVISNCVVNLSPDKPQVFREAFRVLKSGGRLAVSDILLSAPLPADVAKLAASWIACVGGASSQAEYFGAMQAAGFVDVQYTRREAGPLLSGSLQDPMWKAAVAMIGQARIDALLGTVFSYTITATKP